MAIFESAFRSGHQAIRRASTLYRRFAHTVTIGVRAVVIDDEERVFLVKHSYVSGWYLPGGGVEIGEALGTALARELLEEGNIKLTAPPQFFGMYLNRFVSRRDHVALYVVRSFQQSPPERNSEIVAHGFFPPEVASSRYDTFNPRTHLRSFGR